MESTGATALKAQGATPVIDAPKPFLTRINLWFRLWAFKLMVFSALKVLRTFKLKGMGLIQPTFKKRYPVGANLENHVYMPSSWKAGTTLNLYIDIHGGGFAVGKPDDDASFCQFLAEKHNLCVVSLDYRKAPSYPFPQQTQDLVEIVQAVLDDQELPVDRSRVAMGGFSAGGNLSLSVAQRPEMQGKIKGLLLWYPVTDFSSKFKGVYKNASDGSPDVLANLSDLFNYGYVPEGQDRCDPALSPIYVDRSKLPEKMFFIGAEHDVLCHEAEVTAEFYAEAEGVTINDKGKNDWTAGGIRWTKVLDAQHGFNLIKKKEPEAEQKRLEITEVRYADAAEWLKKEIYV